VTIVLALSLQLPVTGQCADSTPAGLLQLKGSPYFLDETAIKISNDIATFKLYTSADASDPGAVVDALPGTCRRIALSDR
jgi:hypothetical protein